MINVDGGQLCRGVIKGIVRACKCKESEHV